MTAINLLDVLDFVRRHALRIFAWGLGMAIAAYFLAFLIPPSYKATAVILPPEEDELSSALSPLRRSLGSLGGLGRLGGQYFTQADIALAILRSRRMAETAVGKFDLRSVYKVKKSELAVRALRGRTRVALGTDGTISVAVEDRNPARSAELANFFIDELDRYNREFRSFRARRTRGFLEQRVAEADSSLRAAESALVAYQRRRGSVVLPDVRSGAEGAANLLLQKTMTEVDLELARGYAPGSDEVRRLEARVRELRHQLGELPQTQAGASGLLREVAVQQQVLMLLTSQLEEARIREVMDTPTIQILDRASPPEIPVWPRRSWIALMGGLFGLSIGVAQSGGARWLTGLVGVSEP